MHPWERTFRAVVQEALALLPSEFQAHLENVVFIVEDWPEDELLDQEGFPEDEVPYGLYVGTALTDRPHDHQGLPDRIYLFAGPLLEDFQDPEDLRREIAITLLHEVAHHFGIGEERLRELGWG